MARRERSASRGGARLSSPGAPARPSSSPPPSRPRAPSPSPAPSPRRRDAGSTVAGSWLSPSALAPLLLLLLAAAKPGESAGVCAGGRPAFSSHGSRRVPSGRGSGGRDAACGGEPEARRDYEGAGCARSGEPSLRRLWRARALRGHKRLRRAGDSREDSAQPRDAVGREGVGAGRSAHRAAAPSVTVAAELLYAARLTAAAPCDPAQGTPSSVRARPLRPAPHPHRWEGAGSAGQTHVNRPTRPGGEVERLDDVIST